MADPDEMMNFTQEYKPDTRKMEWRQQGDANEWTFGEPVRGAIRCPAAEVYFDPDMDGPDGGWRWVVTQGARDEQGQRPNGYAGKFEWAIKACEEALGIIDRDAKTTSELLRRVAKEIA